MDELKQYFFDREAFVDVVTSLFTDTGQLVAIYALCESNAFVGSFHCFVCEDEYYIFDMDTGVAINWYKHLGRTNTCNNAAFELVDLYLFFEKLHNSMY